MSKRRTGARQQIGIASCVLAFLAVGARAATSGTVLLFHDFETVDAEAIFTNNTYNTSTGQSVSTTTMEAIGASNKVALSSLGYRWGAGEASNRVMRLYDTDSPWATYMSEEKGDTGSEVIARLNALPPGVYYLRLSYDQHLVCHDLKFGVRIWGSNGGVSQTARGAPGAPGYFTGPNEAYWGVNFRDPENDGAFTKCGTEHELNATVARGYYPWHIRIVSADGSPDNLNVFKQGSFTKLALLIWQTKKTDGLPQPECYFDNIKIEYFSVDPDAPLYLDEILRTQYIDPLAHFNTAYVNFDATGTLYQADGMVERIGMISSNNVATTNYTRSGATISFAPYVHGTATLSSFGSGLLGYAYPDAGGVSRYSPLWIEGDGQTKPARGTDFWTLRDLGLASRGFGCHANQFITFDTHRIRAYLLGNSQLPLVITGSYGMAGEVQNAAYTSRGGVWVDGAQKFLSAAKKRADPSDAFTIRLDPSDRYLTFAVLDNATYDYGQDCGIFKDVLLTLKPIGTVIAVE